MKILFITLGIVIIIAGVGFFASESQQPIGIIIFLGLYLFLKGLTYGKKEKFEKRRPNIGYFWDQKRRIDYKRYV